jgi:polysaccharide biosynthesis protein PslJ
MDQIDSRPAGRHGTHRRPGPARMAMTQVAALDPVVFLTGYLILLMLIPSTLVVAALGGIGTPALALAFLITLWFIASWIVGSIRLSGAGGRAVRVAMLLFALAVVASFIAGMTRQISQEEVLSADSGLITVAAWSGLVVVVSRSLDSYQQLNKLMRRAVVLASIVAAVGIFEYYSGINVASYIHIPGLSPSTTVAATDSRNGLVRPSSTAVQPIELGVVMSMMLPFALQQALDPDRFGWIRKWLPVLLISAAIPLTVSRSSIIGGAVALLFFVPTWSGRQIRGFLIACVVGLGAMQIAAPNLLGTLTQYFAGLFSGANAQTSVYTRTEDYGPDFVYIRQRPIFGRGWFTYLPDIYRPTDNTYLLTLIEMGIVGVLVVLVVFLAATHCAAAGRRFAPSTASRLFGQAVIAAVMSAMVCSFTFDSLTFPMFTGVLFLLIGVAGAYQSIMTPTPRLAEPVPAQLELELV